MIERKYQDLEKIIKIYEKEGRERTKEILKNDLDFKERVITDIKTLSQDMQETGEKELQKNLKKLKFINKIFKR